MNNLMEAILEGNIGMIGESEVNRNRSSNFDMNNLHSAVKEADLKKAKIFRDETCIRKFENDQYLPLPIISTPLSQLGEYGVGVELYFKLVKNIGILFFIISCISIYPIYQNSNGHGLTAGDIRQRWDTWHVSNTNVVNYNSQINDNQDSLKKLFIYDAVYTGIFVLFIIYFQIYSSNTISNNFEHNVTLADYSIEVKGLPKEGINTSEVASHFSQFGQVIEVYLARHYNGVLSAYKERALLSYELGFLRLLEAQGKGDKEVSAKIEKIIGKMKKFDEKIEKNEANSDKTHDELPVIRAFVVFDSISAKVSCLKAYSSDNTCCKRLKYQSEHLKLLKRFPLRVKKTYAPNNILWENLEVSRCSRCLRRTFSLFCVVVALVLSIVMVYSLKSYQDNLPSDQDCLNVDTSQSYSYAKLYYTSNTQSYCYCKGQSLSSILDDSSLYSYCGYFLEKITVSVIIRVLVSFGVIFVNFIMKIIFRILSRFERVGSKSAEQLKVMSKVFIATFINTALVILAVNANFSDLHTYTWLPKFIFNASYSDFTRDWYVNVGSTIVTTMLVTIFSPHVLLLLTFYPLGLCKRHCCLKRSKTQRDLNAKFAGADFDLATRNSFVLTVVFSCYLYSGGMPILNIICCLTMFVLFWTDKFLILRHYSKPPHFNHLLHERVLHYLPFAVIFHCGFSLYMYGATDIFPKSVRADGTYPDNDISSRIKQYSGYVNIILAMAAFLGSAWVYFYSKIFACVMKQKVTQIDDEKLAAGTINHEMLNIKRHGLSSYQILENHAYSDLILAMDAAAQNVKKSRDHSKISEIH